MMAPIDFEIDNCDPFDLRSSSFEIQFDTSMTLFYFCLFLCS